MNAQDLLGPDAVEQYDMPAIGVDCLADNLVTVVHTRSGCRRLATVLGAEQFRLPSPPRREALHRRSDGAHVGSDLGGVMSIVRRAGTIGAR